jgi:biopolymer transport protein TolR
MVAAPMLTVGVPIELPRTSAGALPSQQEEPLTVTLTLDGRVMIQTTEVSPDNLIPQLRAIAAMRQWSKLWAR